MNQLNWATCTAVQPVVEQKTETTTAKVNTPTSQVTIIEAIKHLIKTYNIPLSKSTSTKFTHVSKSNEMYPYMKTALDKRMIWTTTDPQMIVSCDVYMVMKWIAEWWNITKSPEIKENYWNVAESKGMLNWCTNSLTGKHHEHRHIQKTHGIIFRNLGQIDFIPLEYNAHRGNHFCLLWNAFGGINNPLHFLNIGQGRHLRNFTGKWIRVHSENINTPVVGRHNRNNEIPRVVCPEILFQPPVDWFHKRVSENHDGASENDEQRHNQSLGFVLFKVSKGKLQNHPHLLPCLPVNIAPLLEFIVGDFTVQKMHNMVAHINNTGIVGGENECRHQVRIAVQLLHQRKNLLWIGTVQICGGLVSQNHGSLRDKRTRNGNTLSLSSRKLSGLVVLPFGKSNLFYKIVDPLFLLLFWKIVNRTLRVGILWFQEKRKFDILVNIQHGNQIEGLKNEPQMTAAETCYPFVQRAGNWSPLFPFCVGRRGPSRIPDFSLSQIHTLVNINAVDVDAAGRRNVNQSKHIQNGWFTWAGGPWYCGKFALLNGKRRILHRNQVLLSQRICFAKMINRYYRHKDLTSSLQFQIGGFHKTNPFSRDVSETNLLIRFTHKIVLLL